MRVSVCTYACARVCVGVLVCWCNHECVCQTHGYDGAFAAKSRARTVDNSDTVDGCGRVWACDSVCLVMFLHVHRCATFFHTQRYTLVEQRTVEYQVCAFDARCWCVLMYVCGVQSVAIAKHATLARDQVRACHTPRLTRCRSLYSAC
jgi:hypothetical protein